MTVVPLVADDDIRVHIATADITSAREAWLRSVAECDSPERVVERYDMWHTLYGVRAQQTLDDLGRHDAHRRTAARPDGGALA